MQPRPPARTQMPIQAPAWRQRLAWSDRDGHDPRHPCGRRAPVTRVRLRDSRCQHSAATIAKALYGQWRAEHLCALAQAVALSEVSHQTRRACDRQSEAHLGICAAPSGRQGPPGQPPRQTKRQRHQPAFAVRGSLPRVTGVDLPPIEGLDDTTAWIVIRAVGLDRSRWPPVKPCTSWVGLCPPPRRLGDAGLPHSQSALGAFFRCMQTRLGPPTAITATAHK